MKFVGRLMTCEMDIFSRRNYSKFRNSLTAQKSSGSIVHQTVTQRAYFPAIFSTLSCLHYYSFSERICNQRCDPGYCLQSPSKTGIWSIIQEPQVCSDVPVTCILFSSSSVALNSATWDYQQLMSPGQIWDIKSMIY